MDNFQPVFPANGKTSGFGMSRDSPPSDNFRHHPSRSQSVRSKVTANRYGGRTIEDFYPNKKYNAYGNKDTYMTGRLPQNISKAPRIEPENFRSIASVGQDKNNRYKTEICRNFKERATCIYGDQCQFAHGRQELRDVIKSNKYKTKSCEKYWVTGYCAYGPRCNFLHYEDESCGARSFTHTDTVVNDCQPKEDVSFDKLNTTVKNSDEVLAEAIDILNEMEKNKLTCEPKLEDLFVKLKRALRPKSTSTLENHSVASKGENLLEIIQANK